MFFAVYKAVVSTLLLCQNNAANVMLRQWCRRRGCRGCKRIPRSFDFLKIREKSLKIWTKSL